MPLELHLDPGRNRELGPGVWSPRLPRGVYPSHELRVLDLPARPSVPRTLGGTTPHPPCLSTMCSLRGAGEQGRGPPQGGQGGESLGIVLGIGFLLNVVGKPPKAAPMLDSGASGGSGSRLAGPACWGPWCSISRPGREEREGLRGQVSVLLSPKERKKLAGIGAILSPRFPSLLSSLLPISLRPHLSHS